MREEEQLLTAVLAGADHTVTPQADGTFIHSWTFPSRPVRFDGFDTIESEEELQQVLAARQPQYDRLLVGWERGLQEIADHVTAYMASYPWRATVASVQHLPKRTRLRLLARIRRDIRQAGG